MEKNGFSKTLKSVWESVYKLSFNLLTTSFPKASRIRKEFRFCIFYSFKKYSNGIYLLADA